VSFVYQLIAREENEEKDEKEDEEDTKNPANITTTSTNFFVYVLCGFGYG
jgi:hypothetical protein